MRLVIQGAGEASHCHEGVEYSIGCVHEIRALGAAIAKAIHGAPYSGSSEGADPNDEYLEEGAAEKDRSDTLVLKKGRIILCCFRGRGVVPDPELFFSN
jgi:hypothetical protein